MNRLAEPNGGGWTSPVTYADARNLRVLATWNIHSQKWHLKCGVMVAKETLASQARVFDGEVSELGTPGSQDQSTFFKTICKRSDRTY